MQQAVIPFLSIVVASHRQDYIEQCVEALLAAVAAMPTPNTEIIVVTDYDASLLSPKYSAVSWEYCVDLSISRKRNCGIKKARGAIIGFVDDDCLVAKDWINIAAAFFYNHPDCAGVEGHTTIVPPEKTAGHLREFKRLERAGFRTNNIFYKKEALQSAGLFDERFTLQREDLDLAFTIMRNSGTIEYCGELSVSHCFRPDEPWDLLKNCINRRFDPLLFKKHPVRYRQYVKQPVPPAIALVGLVWLLLIYDAAFYRAFLLPGIALLVIVCAIGAWRRNQYKLPAMLSFLRDVLAYALSPFVLWGALVYGSLKWKKLLVW
jgi:glycosyltransferase involved in cell wall biosynthesis